MFKLHDLLGFGSFGSAPWTHSAELQLSAALSLDVEVWRVSCMEFGKIAALKDEVSFRNVRVSVVCVGALQEVQSSSHEAMEVE